MSKKLISLFFAVIMVFGLASCGKNSTETASEVLQSEERKAGSQDHSEPPIKPDDGEKTPDISRIIVSEGAGGSGSELSFDKLSAALPDEILTDISSALPPTAPVYSYKYGNGQGGPLIKYSDEDVEHIKENMANAACFFFGEDAAADAEFTAIAESSFGVPFIFETTLNGASTSGDVKVIGTIDRVTFTLDDGVIFMDDVVNGYENVELVKKCMEYMEFDSPVLNIETGSFGSSIEIVNGDLITFDEGDVPELKSISLDVDGNGLVNSVHLINKKLTAEVSNAPIMSCDDALAYLKEAYGEEFDKVDPENIRIQKVYNYEYKQETSEDGSYGGMGFYVPCFRFYLGGIHENADKCAVVDLRISDFDVQAIEITDMEMMAPQYR